MEAVASPLKKNEKLAFAKIKTDMVRASITTAMLRPDVFAVAERKYHEVMSETGGDIIKDSIDNMDMDAVNAAMEMMEATKMSEQTIGRFAVLFLQEVAMVKDMQSEIGKIATLLENAFIYKYTQYYCCDDKARYDYNALYNMVKVRQTFLETEKKVKQEMGMET